VIATAFGDVTSATHVARAVDLGQRVGPLLFFQSVRTRWPVTWRALAADRPDRVRRRTRCRAGHSAALIEDADADEALVVWVDLGVTEDDRDRAAALS